MTAGWVQEDSPGNDFFADLRLEMRQHLRIHCFSAQIELAVNLLGLIVQLKPYLLAPVPC